MKNRMLIGCGVIAACGLLTASTLAFATPGVNPPAPEDLVVGVLDGRAKARQDGVELKVKQDTTVRHFTLTYTPGSNSGWHSHPGIVVAIVASGSVTRQTSDTCRVETFTAGEAFTEVAPHLVANPSGTDAVLRITQFFPEGASPLREDLPVNPCPAR